VEGRGLSGRTLRRDAEGDLRGDLRWPTILDLWASAVERFGDGEALVDGRRRFTWNELDAKIAEAARAFVALGIDPGDRVAIWVPNVWEWVVALVALQQVGAVLVPLNTRYKGTEAGFILDRSRARILLTVDGFLGNDYITMLRDANGGSGEGAGQPNRPVADLPSLEQVVVLRTDQAPAGTITWDEFLGCAGGASTADVAARIKAIEAGSVCDILFTSGTTGQPKGVVCSHGQSIRAVTTWADIVGLRADDRYLIVNPFFHSFGYRAGILACLVTGAVMVPLAVFDVPAIVERVMTERISMLPGAPSIYQSMLNHPDREQLAASSLRLAVTGAAAIPVSLVEEMRTGLGFETVVTAYGLSEGTGFATMCRADDDAETIATTSGRAMPGIDVKIVDDAGAAVDAGHPGEVVVRGYNVMRGYFEDPEQTRQTIEGGGWLHTGDIGVMDERGYVAITDRKKDMFIVGGFNAYPAEIEAALVRHPAVSQAAVVGVPDQRLGEVGVAYVIPARGETVEPDELIAWARDQMANYKVPRRVILVDQLPLNAAGKVLKFELRQRAAVDQTDDQES